MLVSKDKVKQHKKDLLNIGSAIHKESKTSLQPHLLYRKLTLYFVLHQKTDKSAIAFSRYIICSPSNLVIIDARNKFDYGPETAVHGCLEYRTAVLKFFAKFMRKHLPWRPYSSNIKGYN